MHVLYSLVAVLVIALLGYAGGAVAGLRGFFGVVLPYAAVAVFLAGVLCRVVKWARSPVPFRITTTAGQQKSLPWIRSSRVDNPHSALGVAGRMALEVLLFRSLFRNTGAELREGPRLVFAERKLLWLGALAFHWSFLFILLRHLRFFVEPVPAIVLSLQAADGFFQIGTPVVYATDAVILAALAYLLSRRLLDPSLRYISLFTDYMALFLLIGLAGSGVLLRYFFRESIVGVKELAMGLVSFSPSVPAEAGPFFFVHLTLLSSLVAYFPFSKLMHMGGVFLSPTRNLANNNRRKRHINPWNAPVKVHTYEEWEEEFRDKMVAAGLPLDRG